MFDFFNRLERCTICKEAHTSIHCEVMPGLLIYVCNDCLEAARENFIWVCVNCGQVFVRPKTLVLQRLQDEELKRAYAECRDMQIIQGIDICIECDPEAVFDHVDSMKHCMEC